MREILFRGKRTDNGEWVYGWITTQFKKHTGGALLTRIQSVAFGVGEQQVQTHTVGQFTGLYDKNGKPIFEGDIVIMDMNAVIVKGLVKYQGAAYYIATNSDLWDIDNYYTLEVIGNKHDDPMILAELDYEE